MSSRLSKDGWELKECSGCGLLYLTNPPVYEELTENLAWEKNFAAEEKRRAEAQPVKAKVNKLTRMRLHSPLRRKMPEILARYAKPGRLVDLGCGTGGKLMKLPEPYVPYGIEISKALAAEAQDKLQRRGGGCIHANCLDGLKQVEDDYFSGAMLHSYLEHEVQPLAVLQELRRVLVPGGVAIIKVPNYASINRRVTGKNWAGLRYPDHVQYFTPRSLAAMVRKANLAIERFNFFDTIPTSDNMWMIVKKPVASAT